ncbi:MAG TPA: HD domain-containing phosphohydrolase [Thermoleophilia bacterium]|nr:HD domain-containing phosphohydrolase [Thermoleophilia bacterium]
MAVVQDSVALYWQRALAGSGQLAFVMDTSRRIVAVSAGMARALGAPVDELVGNTCNSLMHDAGGAPLDCPLHDLLLDGEQHESEIWSETLGRRLLVTVTPLADDECGRLSHMLHVAVGVTARSKAEAALRESEARYRSLFEHAPIAMWEEDDSAVKMRLGELAARGIDDIEGYLLSHPDEYELCVGLRRVLDVNRAAIELFEARDRDELLARNAELYRHARDRGVHRFWAGMLSGQRSVTFEELNTSLGGRELYVLETCTVVPGHEKSYDRVYVADVDVTERKAAERALRLSQSRYARVERVGHIGTWEYDIASERFWASPETRVLLGLGRSEETLSRAEISTAAVDPVALEEAFRALVEEGTEFDRAFEILPRDSLEPRTVWAVATVERSEDGTPTAVVGVIQDVTERRRMEQALREREAQLEQAQRIAHVGDYELDITAGTWTSSPALDEILGIDDDYVHDYDGWFGLIHPDDLSGTAAYFDDQVRRNRQPYDREFRIVRPADGEERWVHCLGTLETSEDGQLLRMSGVIQDVTARRRDQEELRLGAERLRRTVEGTVQAMGQLVESRDPYTAGHERRVAQLACAIADRLGWGEAEIDELTTAALVHDIGKIAVPSEILSKPGRLSEMEFALIKSHPRTAHEILAPIAFTSQVAEIVLQHHERLDGSGYPRGLGDGEILPAARILAIADVVEAMTTHRPYRPALPIEEAVAEIAAGLGTRYDREAGRACLQLLEEGFALDDEAAGR